MGSKKTEQKKFCQTNNTIYKYHHTYYDDNVIIRLPTKTKTKAKNNNLIEKIFIIIIMKWKENFKQRNVTNVDWLYRCNDDEIAIY